MDFIVADEQVLVRLGHILAEVNVRTWIPEDARGSVFCIHGFTGNARDFDIMAEFLAYNGYRII